MKSQPIMHHNMNASKPEALLHKINKAKSRDVTNEEMQSLLAKLKDLVPNMPKNRKLSKLEIIQYVIDYIVDLQNALDTHPASRNSVVSPMSTHTTVSPNRQPLGVLSTTPNSIVNTCTVQEVCQVDKIPAHMADLVTVAGPRSVSC